MLTFADAVDHCLNWKVDAAWITFDFYFQTWKQGDIIKVKGHKNKKITQNMKQKWRLHNFIRS